MMTITIEIYDIINYWILKNLYSMDEDGKHRLQLYTYCSF